MERVHHDEVERVAKLGPVLALELDLAGVAAGCNRDRAGRAVQRGARVVSDEDTAEQAPPAGSHDQQVGTDDQPKLSMSPRSPPSGVGSSYRGHEGVREWFARLRLLGHDHQIVLSETRDVGGGRVFATGSLTLAREAGVAPFSAVERIDRGLIVAAHHYLTDSDMIERLGLIS